MLTRRSLLANAASVAAVGAISPALMSQALAQTVAPAYPDRPIRIIVGYAAGGGVDIVARLLSEPMKQAFGGQTIIVENRTGASALLAAGAVAKAEGTPVHNPQELIAYAKANAGKLSFSSSGVGNPQQLAGELMNSMAGTNVLHVPYRGSAPAVTDVATGAVTMSFSSLAAALPLIQSGKIRAVAVTSKERMPQLPDVPPLSEGAPGLAQYELLNWFGLFATAGTPPDVVERLNDIVNNALATPAIADKLMPQGIVPKPMSVKEFGSFVESETEKFGAIVKAADIKLGN